MTPLSKAGQRNPMYGKQHSAEARAKMSAARSGKQRGADNPMFGRKHSPESIARMTAAREGKALGNTNARRDTHVASYYSRHRDEIRVRRRERLETSPEYRQRQNDLKRSSVLRMRYGLSQADYDALLAKQGHKCAICASTEAGTNRSKNFDVDHCHATGKVRGLLCRNCNVTAGVLEKKRELISKIEAYLALHKGATP